MQGSDGEDEGESAAAGGAFPNAPDIHPDSGSPAGGRGIRAALRPGTAGSAVLHALVALFLLYGFTAPEPAPASVPVDLVVLEPETTSPAAKVPPVQRTALPRIAEPAKNDAPPPPQRTELASLVPPAAPKPTMPIPPSAKPDERVPDALDSKLQALSKLRAPSANREAGAGAAGAANGSGPPGPGGYSVKDYVRAQVERRWNLDLSELGSREFVIAIKVVLLRDGTVDSAEIVDRNRFLSDAVFRSIALSARNAILLSSPIALPAGDYGEVTELTLDLNPRDTVR